MAKAGYAVTPAEMRPIVPLIQERLKTLSEVVDKTDFFFQEVLAYDARLLIGNRMTAAESLAALRKAREVLAGLPDLQPEKTELPLRSLVGELGLKTGQLFGIIRVAVTGKQVAPPLFDTMAILGKKTCLNRIDQAIDGLSSLPA
jgi:glutamyl-tRNA synthetase